MADHQPHADAAEPLRYVFTTLVRCPACGSDHYRVYGHGRDPDAKTQYAQCRAEDCGHKFLVVFEDPFSSVEQ